MTLRDSLQKLADANKKRVVVTERNRKRTLLEEYAMTELTLDAALDAVKAAADLFAGGLAGMPEVMAVYTHEADNVCRRSRTAVLANRVSSTDAVRLASGLAGEIGKLARARHAEPHGKLALSLEHAGAPFDKALRIAMGAVGIEDRLFSALADSERQRVFVEVINPVTARTPLTGPTQTAADAAQEMRVASSRLWVATVVLAAYGPQVMTNTSGAR